MTSDLNRRRDAAARLAVLAVMLLLQGCGVLPQTGPPGQDLYHSRRTD